ncbi:tyrosine-protein phosphatase non-receptor type 9-like isoform X1 [Acipenser ruthenus]|uniref:tyrosine-protein phosphatase non-receptor type 9-like isoform X1 n=2 Tax=Acipenser ruthenus TaxID=7906 RepID=UPI002741984F|nr:tyrosine-protein phosphatase non-receptor type 9-like isoform X1 [Acipenser ruthenus]
MAESLTAQEELTVEEFFTELKNREQPNVVLVSQNTAVKFLMARKFDVSRAIDLFQAYKNTRLKEGIYNISPDEEPLRSELLSGKFTVLPGRDAKGAALALFTARLHRPDVTTHKAVLQAIIYQLDRAIESVETQRDGLIFIYDMTSSTYGNFDYELCVKILNLLKGAFPARLKCVFIVSSPLWFRAPFAVLRLFVREKLRERVCTVKAHELANHIPMESLPEHLGGSSKYSHVAWIQSCVNSTQGQQNGDCMDSLFQSYTLDQNPVSDGLNSNCTPQTVTDNTKHQHNHYHENRTSNLHADPSSLGSLQNWNSPVVTANYDGADTDSSVNTNGRKPPPQSETPPDTPLHKHASEELAVPPLPQKSRPLPSVMEMSIHLPEDGGMHIQELVQHIKRKKKKGIYQEYEEIRKEPPSGTFDYSKKPCNQIKNRYSDVLCLDQSRVKLNVVDDDDETSDYINASFMDGYKRKNAYVAAQGPLPKTFGDFWRMVWEQKVLIIVMTTRVVERGRIKCGQYWPLEVGQTEEYGQFLIRNIHIEMFQDFKLSHLEVYNKETGESRDVAHYLYMIWPDFGVPKSASAMLDFRSQVKQHQEAAFQAFGSEWTGPPGGPPIVVHCSAGIGRTGTFCTLDICLSRLEDIGTVDVNQTVKRMRTQRAFSIQTWDQYYFCYMAVLEYAQRRGLLAPVEWSDSDLETDSE